MYLDLSAFPVQETTEIVETEEVASWLQVYHEFRGAERPLHPAHGDIVARIRSPVLPAVLRREGRIVSCGLGVLDGEYFGIFDMVTEPASRKLGHARSLISDMLSWAKSQGARMAYLQVVEENHAAVHLYRRLGFRDLYRYWYRVAD
jgi:GNAT superfamily N-acetyltransferase